MIPSSGPPMSVLDRVKMFLPQIEKANADLEKEIVLHGKDRFLIDKDLENQLQKPPMITETDLESSPSSVVEKVVDKMDTQEKDDATNSDEIQQEVELSFALGDFNETALAKAEEELRIEAQKEGVENDDGDDVNDD